MKGGLPTEPAMGGGCLGVPRYLREGPAGQGARVGLAPTQQWALGPALVRRLGAISGGEHSFVQASFCFLKNPGV